MAAEFKHLFTPIKVGTMTVPNRILSTPHITGMAEADGLPGPRQTAYWESKARGGVGLIATQAYPVHESHYTAFPLVFRNEEFNSRWKTCLDALHQHGSKVTMQLWHAGRNGGGGPTGRPIWAPSPVPVKTNWEVPHVMDDDEIREVIAAYAFAAVRAREAGLDAAEIHFAHGYLIQQFMSPLTNLRDDEWGGSWEKRLRFGLEIINAVRAAVGNDWTVGIRMSGDEFTDGGYTVDDMVKYAAPTLAATGKIDFINVTSGNYNSRHTIFPPMYFPIGAFVYCAAAIKAAVNIPVYCVGRINDPVQAEQILANNQADIIGMNRATIADPELGKKAREGRLDEIRKCIACNEGCAGRVAVGAPMSCARNPVISRELDWEVLKPAAIKKKVVVVGGGAAGLEAARVAAGRGHSVTLIEKGSELGGQTNIAAKAPGRLDFAEVGRWYTVQLRLAGVEVMLNTEASADMVLSMNPDAVVVATGSKANKPNLPGMDQANVVTHRDVLSDKAQVGNNVLVVALEHHTQGMSTADFLAERGKQVEIINEEYSVGSLTEGNTKHMAYQRLAQAGVKRTPNTGLKRVEGNTVTVVDTLTGVERTISGVDTVVIADLGKADDGLGKALKGRVKELHVIGQANSPRRLFECTYDGGLLGRQL